MKDIGTEKNIKNQMVDDYERELISLKSMVGNLNDSDAVIEFEAGLERLGKLKVKLDALTSILHTSKTLLLD